MHNGGMTFGTKATTPLRIHAPSQVLLRQESRNHSQVIQSRGPSAMLTLPEGGAYIIEVRAVSKGGEGAVSAQVRLLTSSGRGRRAPPPYHVHDPLGVCLHSEVTLTCQSRLVVNEDGEICFMAILLPSLNSILFVTFINILGVLCFMAN